MGQRDYNNGRNFEFNDFCYISIFQDGGENQKGEAVSTFMILNLICAIIKESYHCGNGPEQSCQISTEIRSPRFSGHLIRNQFSAAASNKILCGSVRTWGADLVRRPSRVRVTVEVVPAPPCQPVRTVTR